jgi:hypothetical protein
MLEILEHILLVIIIPILDVIFLWHATKYVIGFLPVGKDTE